MILIKNGKLQKDGLAFSLPENYYYESVTESIPDDGMEFFSEDQSKRLNYDFLVSRGKSGNSMDHLFAKDILGYVSYHKLTPISPIIFNGLFGHYVFYKGTASEEEPATQYFEIHFDLGESEEGYLLFSLRVTDYEGDVINYVQSDEFQRILSGISRADE